MRRVAWAIKELLYDLGRRGADAVGVRLRARFGLTFDRESLGQLLGHIPLDVVSAAQVRWFPRLDREVPAYRKRRAAALQTDPSTNTVWLQPSPPAHRVQSVQLALAGPMGPGTTAVLDRLILAGASSGSPTRTPIAAQRPVQLAQASTDLLSGTSRLLNRKSLRLDDYRQLLKEDRTGNNSIFSKDRSSRPSSNALKAKPKGRSKSTRSTTNRSSQGKPRASKSSRSRDPGPRASAPRRVRGRDVDPERWARSGGWYRREFTLFYRPVEHHDMFMRSWLDIAAAAYGGESRRYGQALLRTFQNKNTIGKCVRCHSVDRLADGKLEVNWKPFTPNPDRQNFTVFDHATHFSMAGERGCQSCHRLNPRARFAVAYRGLDPTSFESNFFAPIERKVCAECHVPKSAGNACVQCHRYHVGEFMSAPIVTAIARRGRATTRFGTVSASPWGGLVAGPTAPAPRRKPATPTARAKPSAPQARAKPTPKAAKPKRHVSTRQAKPKRQVARRPPATRRAPSPRRKPRPPHSRTIRDVGQFAIQLASFLTEDRAERSKRGLQRTLAEYLDGQVLLVERIEVRNRTIYRVVARPFDAHGKANRICRRIAGSSAG